MSDDHTTRNRNRTLLLLLFAMFFGSMLVAGLLRFSGWRPQGTKSSRSRRPRARRAVATPGRRSCARTRRGTK